MTRHQIIHLYIVLYNRVILGGNFVEVSLPTNYPLYGNLVYSLYMQIDSLNSLCNNCHNHFLL